MSITFDNSAGASFETLARKFYGDEREAWRISAANAGGGTQLIIPDIPQNIDDAQGEDFGDGPILLLDGVRFRYWEYVRINRALDRFDVIEFGGPFDYKYQPHRDNFKPFSYRNASFIFGGETLFTGTLISVDPDPEGGLVRLSGYSTAGVFNDCTFPASSFPLQFEDQTLEQIAAYVSGVFGIPIAFESPSGEAFGVVRCEYDQTVLAFLATLASERGMVIGASVNGGAVFRSAPITGNAVAQLVDGFAPVLSVAPSFNPQGFFSHVTGIDSTNIGNNGEQFTIKNPAIKALRPMTLQISDVTDGDIVTATKAAYGRMIGNTVEYRVTVATWRTPSGKLWAPADVVTLTAPRAMVYNPYSFIVREVDFFRSAGEEYAELVLCILGSFTGEIVEKMPWD